MLVQECPDILDVSTPNALHFECAMGGLQNGCHVLCEKPLVWGSDISTMLTQAEQLVREARARDLLFAVCTQDATALPLYHSLPTATPAISPQTKAADIAQFHAEMETGMARGPLRAARDVWIDMAPHPLSLLLSWLPQGQIREQSLEVRFEGAEASAKFEFQHPAGSCSADIVVRHRPGGTLVRRFGVNGNLAECSGQPGPTGEYESVLRRGSVERRGRDFMSLLIQQFVDAARDRELELVTANHAALNNLRLQLQIMEAARES
jgi:predicted dehydrogenase